MPVRVKTLDDESSPVGEPTEVVLVELGDEPGADFRQGYRVAGGKILDDEATLTAADASTVEGNDPDPDAFEELVFELGLDRAPTAPVVVGYELQGDTRSQSHAATAGSDCAVAGTDYLLWDDPVNPGGFTDEGTVTIDAGVQRASIPAVRICGDRLVEHSETFWLEVTVVSGEAIEAPSPPDDGGAWGTIRHDDVPVVSVSPAAAEGTEGQADSEGQADPLAFTVGLTVGGRPAQLTEDVTVDYEIGGGTAAAPGPADADYAVTLDGTALAGPSIRGTLTFAVDTSGTPPVTEHLFEVELLADYLLENPETFQLDLDNLRDPVRAAVFEDRDSDGTDDSYAVGTILDDPPPVLSVSGFAGPEGSDQSVVVSLAAARSGKTVTVDYAITGDEVASNGDTATAPGHPAKPADFEPVPDTDPLTGTLTLDESTLSVPVEVSLLPDATHEDSETLRLTLQNPTGAVLFDRDPVAGGVQAFGEGIITNVDSPWLSVDNTSAREGELLTFTVTLCNPIPREEVTVSYQTRAHSAAAGRDFDALAGTVLFPDDLAARQVSEGCGPGVTAEAKSLTVPVTTLNDRVEDSDEEVHLVLSAADTRRPRRTPQEPSVWAASST